MAGDLIAISDGFRCQPGSEFAPGACEVWLSGSASVPISQSGQAISSCQTCAAGSVAPFSGSATCVSCGVGRYQDPSQLTQQVCSVCQPGQYQKRPVRLRAACVLSVASHRMCNIQPVSIVHPVHTPHRMRVACAHSAHAVVQVQSRAFSRPVRIVPSVLHNCCPVRPSARRVISVHTLKRAIHARRAVSIHTHHGRAPDASAVKIRIKSASCASGDWRVSKPDGLHFK
jgi:hypothetical protein